MKKLNEILGTEFTAEEIADAVRFQEQYYDSEIEVV